MTRTDTVSRIVNALSETVYAALVDPTALIQWLPPTGMSARFEKFDARPGGGFRMVLTYADSASSPGKSTADSDIVDIRFLELTPACRIVQAITFESDDQAFSGVMTMTWELSPVDAGTRVEIRADNVPQGISADDHAAGMASSLANLAAYIEEQSDSDR
jgi:uncharacterized protein YndB with AHSA1/START domain